MAEPTLANLTHRECRQMALVLEGVAGTLQEGGPVGREDLRDAAQMAEWVWQAGPKPNDARAKDFESAHALFVRSSDGCASGNLHDANVVARAGERMASQLRRSAEESLSFATRKELPTAVDQGIARLARLYASNARRAATAQP